MLLGAPQRENRAVISLQVLLDLHPVHGADAHLLLRQLVDLVLELLHLGVASATSLTRSRRGTVRGDPAHKA